MLSCDRCGVEIPEGQKYCPNCGVKAKTTESVHKKQYVKAARPSIRKVVPGETEQPLGFRNQGSSEKENKKTDKKNVETSDAVAPVQQSREEKCVIEPVKVTDAKEEKFPEAERIPNDAGNGEPVGEESTLPTAGQEAVDATPAGIHSIGDDELPFAFEMPDPTVGCTEFADEVSGYAEGDLAQAPPQEDIPEDIFDSPEPSLDEPDFGDPWLTLINADSGLMPEEPGYGAGEEPEGESLYGKDDGKAGEPDYTEKDDEVLPAADRTESKADADTLESDGRGDNTENIRREHPDANVSSDMNGTVTEKKQNPAKKGRYAQTQKKESKISKQDSVTGNREPEAEDTVPSESGENGKKAEAAAPDRRKKREAEEKPVAPVQQASPDVGQDEGKITTPESSRKDTVKENRKDVAPVQQVDPDAGQDKGKTTEPVSSRKEVTPVQLPLDDRQGNPGRRAGHGEKKENGGKEGRQPEKESLIFMLATKVKRLLSYPMPDEKEEAECIKDFNSDGFYDDTQSSVPPEDAKTSIKQFTLFILWAVIAIATILYMINLIVE